MMLISSSPGLVDLWLHAFNSFHLSSNFNKWLSIIGSREELQDISTDAIYSVPDLTYIISHLISAQTNLILQSMASRLSMTQSFAAIRAEGSVTPIAVELLALQNYTQCLKREKSLLPNLIFGILFYHFCL